MKSNNNYTKTITLDNERVYENSYKPYHITEARRPEILQSKFEPLGPTFDFLEDKTPFTPDTKSIIHTSNKEYESNEKLWDIAPLFNSKYNDLETKSQTFKDIWQYKEKLFAETTLRCFKVTNVIEEMINTEFEEINLIREALFNFLISKNTYKGGHENEKRNEDIVIELNKYEGDSQHDFKPLRNLYFPNEITKSVKPLNKVNGTKVLDAISNITFTANRTRILNSYFEKSPNDFEEDIKVDYLLGDLAGKLDDISYYFTEGPRSSEWNTITDNWIKKRRIFFQENEPFDNIRQLFDTVDERGIEYWLFDACMTTTVKEGLRPPELFTLAKIWDPSTSSTSFERLFEYILSQEENSNSNLTEININPANRFVSDANKTYITGSGYRVFDWTDDAGNSYYDKIFDSLLNEDLINTKFNIKIKLRLAINKDNICYAAICIYIQDIFNSVIFVKNGLGVSELSIGMHYIETEEPSFIYVPNQETITIDPNLKNVIDILYQIIVELSKKSTGKSEFTKNEYYKLLLRFKSSGDHGQSRTVKLINKLFNKPTLLLTGDNLAYVYSIADETPTIAKYYSAKKSHDEHGEEQHKGPQFVVAYFPMKDNPDKYKKLFNKKISIIGSIIDSNYNNPNYNDNKKINLLVNQELFANLQKFISELIYEGDTFISELNTHSQDITIEDYKINKKYIKKNEISEIELTIQSEIDRRIQDLFTRKINDIHFLQLIESIPINMDNLFKNGEEYNYEYIKHYNILINQFISNWYFIKNYIIIVKLIKTNIYDMIYGLDKLLAEHSIKKITAFLLGNISNTTSISRPSRTADIEFNTNIKNSFASVYEEKIKEDKSIIGKPINKELLLDIAVSAPGKSESKGFSDELIDTRERMLNIKLELSSKFRNDLNIPLELYSELINNIEIFKKDYLNKMKQKIDEIPNYGPAINDFFSKCFETNIKNEKIIDTNIKDEKMNSKINTANSILKELEIEKTPSTPKRDELKNTVGTKTPKKVEAENNIVISTVIETLNNITTSKKSVTGNVNTPIETVFNVNAMDARTRRRLLREQAAMKRQEAGKSANKTVSNRTGGTMNKKHKNKNKTKRNKYRNKTKKFRR